MEIPPRLGRAPGGAAAGPSTQCLVVSRKSLAAVASRLAAHACAREAEGANGGWADAAPGVCVEDVGHQREYAPRPGFARLAMSRTESEH